MESYQGATYGFFVSATSTNGAKSDFNDLYAHGNGWPGSWAGTICTNLTQWRTVTAQDTNSIALDPVFYSVGATNFHLAGTSPCIDAGQNLATVQEDGDSEARPASGSSTNGVKIQDIGYDEFVDSDGDTLADVIEKTVTLTKANERDSDFDGLPDDWEVRYGLNPNSSTGNNGASGDPDLDGYSNLAEYLGNSNPMLASSIPNQPPVITSYSPAGAAVFILEEDSVGFSATATDANNDPISYSWRLDGVVKSSSNSWTFATTSESSGSNTLAKV